MLFWQYSCSLHDFTPKLQGDNWKKHEQIYMQTHIRVFHSVEADHGHYNCHAYMYKIK